ncbi:hypothetical protein CEXT_369541 [Caerostris extrusa]|uniref:Uncharacterized protein n=1 Tax=Caerostris extrusa TaxID=172846 RepID=A0AAV4SPH4_CAEEX|nr:hypothetical protein CEXT_369541 [Caerostris extrusa]
MLRQVPRQKTFDRKPNGASRLHQASSEKLQMRPKYRVLVFSYFFPGWGFALALHRGRGFSILRSSKCPHLNEVDRVLGMVTHFGESFAQQKGKYRLVIVSR